MEWLVFVLVAATAIGTALGLVVRPNPLHGALFLVVNLFCVAVLFLMLRAEFLALAQVIVYAGAIMVLFVFAIMVLIPGREETGPDPAGPRALARAAGGGRARLIVVVLVAGRTGGPSPGAPPGGVEAHRPPALHRLPLPVRGDLAPAPGGPGGRPDPGPAAGSPVTPVPPVYYVALSAVLFAIGVVGVLVRRNPLVIFMSIELMLNAANLAFVAFGRATARPTGRSSCSS